MMQGGAWRAAKQAGHVAPLLHLHVQACPGPLSHLVVRMRATDRDRSGFHLDYAAASVSKSLSTF